MSAKTRVPRGLPAIPLRERKIILVCVLCLGMVIIESNEKKYKNFPPGFVDSAGAGQSFSALEPRAEF